MKLWFDRVPPRGPSSCGVTGLRGHCLLWELGEATVRSGGVDPEMRVWGRLKYKAQQDGKADVFLPWFPHKEERYLAEWASLSTAGWLFPPQCLGCTQGWNPGLSPFFVGGRKRQVVRPVGCHRLSQPEEGLRTICSGAQ